MSETPSEPPPAGSEPTEGQSGDSPRPAHNRVVWPDKRFTANRAQRVGNAFVAVLTRWALVPHTYMMTTVGRKTGTPRKTPVTLVEEGTKKWLVAPYGPVSWVLNARAAGTVTLRRGKHSGVYTIRSVRFRPMRRDRC